MTANNPPLTTNQFAAALAVQPGTVRVRFCRTGSYFGVKPIKLPNGRLAWPSDGPARLYDAETEQSAA
jgi:hypothetical protein